MLTRAMLSSILICLLSFVALVSAVPDSPPWKKHPWQTAPWQKQPWQTQPTQKHPWKTKTWHNHPWQTAPWQKHPWQTSSGQKHPWTAKATIGTALNEMTVSQTLESVMPTETAYASSAKSDESILTSHERYEQMPMTAK